MSCTLYSADWVQNLFIHACITLILVKSLRARKTGYFYEVFQNRKMEGLQVHTHNGSIVEIIGKKIINKYIHILNISFPVWRMYLEREN